jgi:hypothetical protein
VTASATSAQPGATILFRISAYTNLTAGAAGKITSTVTPSKTTPAFGAPTFTVDSCTSTSGTTCNLTVPTAKPSQAQVETQITVPKTATAGETVKYSATVTVTDGTSTLNATATAPTITVKAASSASPSATKKTSKPAAAPGSGSASADPLAGANVDIPGLSGSTENIGSVQLGALPAVAGESTTIPAGNASNLFPQISPSSSPTPAPGTQAAVPSKTAGAVADSSRIPLSLGSSEFGAQIIGLIVLLLGVAIAVTRLSLRKTRPNK